MDNCEFYFQASLKSLGVSLGESLLSNYYFQTLSSIRSSELGQLTQIDVSPTSIHSTFNKQISKRKRKQEYQTEGKQQISKPQALEEKKKKRGVIQKSKRCLKLQNQNK